MMDRSRLSSCLTRRLRLSLLLLLMFSFVCQGCLLAKVQGGFSVVSPKSAVTKEAKDKQEHKPQTTFALDASVGYVFLPFVKIEAGFSMDAGLYPGKFFGGLGLFAPLLVGLGGRFMSAEAMFSGVAAGSEFGVFGGFRVDGQFTYWFTPNLAALLRPNFGLTFGLQYEMLVGPHDNTHSFRAMIGISFSLLMTSTFTRARKKKKKREEQSSSPSHPNNRKR